MDVLCEPTAFLTLNKRLFNRNDWVRHICHCFTNHYIVRVPHKSQVLIYAQDNERNDFFSSNCQTSYCELADLLLERDSAQLDIYSIASDSGLYTHHAPAALINVPLIHIWCCILRYFMIKPILYYACFHLKILDYIFNLTTCSEVIQWSTCRVGHMRYDLSVTLCHQSEYRLRSQT